MPIIKLSDSTEIYYENHGPEIKNNDKIKTFIFVHGGPGLVDSRLYGFWHRFKMPTLRMIFIDQRGSGRSDDGQAERLSIEQHARDIDEICTRLHIERPIIGGVSQGGYISLAYAGMFPHKVQALILCNTEAKRNTEERVKAHRLSLVKYFGETQQKAEEISFAVKEIDMHWDSEEYKKFMPYYAKNAYKSEEIALCSQHPSTWQKFMREEFPLFDLTALLSKISCPVLYLAGEYDCVHPPACAEITVKEIEKTNKQVILEIIPNAADPVYRDQELLTESVIRKFLRKIVPLLTDEEHEEKEVESNFRVH